MLWRNELSRTNSFEPAAVADRPSLAKPVATTGIDVEDALRLQPDPGVAAEPGQVQVPQDDHGADAGVHVDGCPGERRHSDVRPRSAR